jgi:hypothetical protein
VDAPRLERNIVAKLGAHKIVDLRFGAGPAGDWCIARPGEDKLTAGQTGCGLD